MAGILTYPHTRTTLASIMAIEAKVEAVMCGVLNDWCTRANVGRCGTCDVARIYLVRQLRKVEDVPPGAKLQTRKLTPTIKSGAIWTLEGEMIASKYVTEGVI